MKDTSFIDELNKYSADDIKSRIEAVRPRDVEAALESDSSNIDSYIAFISDAADNYLEAIAQKAQSTSIRMFGKVITLYTPIYLANYCENRCVYCGFQAGNKIERIKLTPEEIEKEARLISQSGLKHILLLSGESRKHTAPDYIESAVEIMRKYFTSISIEVYPLETQEYERLVKKGADGLTIYQEVYDEALYRRLHPSGKKADFGYRLTTPERAAEAGIHRLGIGALLGLGDPLTESFYTALHADRLMRRYPQLELSVSFPRLRPEFGGFKGGYEVPDRLLVRLLLALRLFLPRAGITISTREGAEFRDNLIGLGVTRMSAGSKTEVGGYAKKEKSVGQFEIDDNRSVEEIKQAIIKRGYQPVFKDWQFLN